MFRYTLDYPQHDPEFVLMCAFLNSLDESYVSVITNYILNQRHYSIDELLFHIGEEIGTLINSLLETLDVDDQLYVYCDYLNQSWGDNVNPEIRRIVYVLMKYYIGTQLPETLEPAFMALNHVELSPNTLLCTLE